MMWVQRYKYKGKQICFYSFFLLNMAHKPYINKTSTNITAVTTETCRRAWLVTYKPQKSVSSPHYYCN